MKMGAGLGMEGDLMGVFMNIPSKSKGRVKRVC